SRSVNENVNQSISRSGSINKSIVGSVVGSEVGSGSGSINENESSGSNASFSSSRKQTSAAYEHYNFSNGNGNVSDLYKFIILYAYFFLIDNSKNFGDSSTSTLWRHFNNNNSKKYGGIITGPMDKFCNFNNNLPEKLLHWIVINDQPFVVTEDQSFREVLTYIKSDINIPSPDTVYCDLSKKFKQTKELVCKHLQETPGLISFTVDAWTNRN
ncbi:14315_t:CDS:2, partial [Entrophospora sp. SA101]